jgi:hypothetical protein
MAAHLGVHRFVDGWLDTYALGVTRRQQRAQTTATPLNPHNTDPRYGVGTTEYMRSVGGYAITLECGQHDDPESPEVAYRAILNTLALLGISDSVKPQPVTNVEHLHLQDVIDKHDAGDSFSREWASFNRLAKGDWIGTRADGTKLVAPFDGYIMFPDAKSLPGNEWYYLARAQ